MRAKEASYVKCKVDTQGVKIESYSQDKAPKFNLILQSFERAADVSDLDADEKLERAQSHKDRGSELFRGDKIDFAQKRYAKALDIITSVSNESESITDATFAEQLRAKCSTLTVQCYVNLAACHLKSDNFADVISTCSNAIKLDERSVKAYFRRGQAHLAKHHYVEAKNDFEKVLELEPSNKAAQNQLKAVQDAVKKEKEMYTKMFV